VGKQNKYLVKWAQFELDPTAWEPAVSVKGLDALAEWARGPRPAYYTRNEAATAAFRAAAAGGSAKKKAKR
jgi:hypothetical protein